MRRRTESRHGYAALSPDDALACYALNSVYNATCKLGDKMAPAQLLQLAALSTPSFVARLAVYAYEQGSLRDTSALLAAYLTKYPDQFRLVAPRVLDNLGQLRKFVNFKRSGILGSRSLGTVAKAYVANFIRSRTAADLFYNSQGTNPSVADMIRLAHAKPTPELDSMFKYLLGYDVDPQALPGEVGLAVAAYKTFLAHEMSPSELPDVPTSMLAAHLGSMSADQLQLYVTKLSPNQLRREVNALTRVKAFDHPTVRAVAEEKLGKLMTSKTKILPLSLLSTVDGVTDPRFSKIVADQLEDSLDYAATVLGEAITQPLTIGLDVSGSMSYGAGGLGKFPNKKMIDLAALLVYPLIKHPLVSLTLVNHQARPIPKEQLQKLRTLEQFMSWLQPLIGGGTTLSTLFPVSNTPDILLVSDNCSWGDLWSFLPTWQSYESKFVDAQVPRLMLWDIVPNGIALADPEPNTLQLAGMSENIYSTIAQFLNKDTRLVDQINAIVLE